MNRISAQLSYTGVLALIKTICVVLEILFILYIGISRFLGPSKLRFQFRVGLSPMLMSNLSASRHIHRKPPVGAVSGPMNWISRCVDGDAPK